MWRTVVCRFQQYNSTADAVNLMLHCVLTLHCRRLLITAAAVCFHLALLLLLCCC
jgi:hypothetical protein